MTTPDFALKVVRSFAEPLRDTVLVTTAELELPGPEIIYVNPAFTHATGYLPEDVIGKTPRMLQGEKTDRAELNRMREALLTEDRFFGSIVNYTKDGREVSFDWYITPLHDSRGAVSYWVSVQHCISEAEKAAVRPKLRALVIHRSALTRAGLREILKSIAAVTEVREAADYAQASQIIASQDRPDLVLAEMAPPEFGDPAELSVVRRLLPSVPVVVLSSVEQEGPLRAALKAGASAFVTMATSRALLVEIVRLVLAGGTFVPWEQIESFCGPRGVTSNGQDAARLFRQLTRRQKEICRMLAQGMTNEQIAVRLGLNLATVKGHVTRTLKVLGVKNRTQAALLFSDWRPD